MLDTTELDVKANSNAVNAYIRDNANPDTSTCAPWTDDFYFPYNHATIAHKAETLFEFNGQTAGETEKFN